MGRGRNAWPRRAVAMAPDSLRTTAEQCDRKITQELFNGHLTLEETLVTKLIFPDAWRKLDVGCIPAAGNLRDEPRTDDGAARAAQICDHVVGSRASRG